MKYFDVRYSASLSAPAAWPALPPALRALATPAVLRLPLSTRAGQGVPPAVLPAGARVGRGQLLAAAVRPTDPAVLAPAAGRLAGRDHVGEVALLNGRFVPAVALEPDEPGALAPALPAEADDQERGGVSEAQVVEALRPLEGVSGREVGEWIDRLRACGVWADRPGCPDLLGQLNDAAARLVARPGRKGGPTSRAGGAAPSGAGGGGTTGISGASGVGRVDTLVCNLLDDEPTLRLNSTLAARHGLDLLAGLRLLAQLLAARNVWVIVEDGAPTRWWSTLRRGRKLKIEVYPVVNDYPQSDPTLLLYALLKRRLKPSRLPTEQRALVIDAAAAIAVGRCALREEAMLRVPLAVRDAVKQETHLLEVPVGASLRQVLGACDIPADGVRLLRGDVLHENEVPADAVVAGGELTVQVLPRTERRLADPCIRCSWCVESCPTRVQPAGVLEASQRGDVALGQHYGMGACIECGVCTYVCPSHLPLLAGIRRLKAREPEG